MNLVITRKNIHKRQHLMPRSGINNLINAWQGKLSFGHASFKLVKYMQTHHLPPFSAQLPHWLANSGSKPRE